MSKIGVEIELLTLTKDFYESNDAQKIIEIGKENDINLIFDCSETMVEFVSKPGTVAEVEQEIYSTLTKLNAVLENTEYRVLPIEYPLRKNFISKIRDIQKFKDKSEILGRDNYHLSGKIMGTHIHFDLDKKKENMLNQINFLNLADPLVIALSACSPGDSDEEFNSKRIYTYRYKIYKDFPYQGNIHKIFSSFEEFDTIANEKFIEFIEIGKSKGIDYSKHTNKYNASWGPLRLNEKFNTIELRSLGSNPDIRIALGIAELILLGLKKINPDPNNIMITEQILSQIIGTTNITEASTRLRELSDLSIKFGLKSEQVYSYCKKFMNFCLNTPNKNNQKYIQILEQILFTKKNMSTFIQNLEADNSEKYMLLHTVYKNTLNLLKNIPAEKWTLA